MTEPSAVAPVILSFRTILLGSLFLAQITHQQVIDAVQFWDRSQIIPTNLLNEHQRNVISQNNSNLSSIQSAQENGGLEHALSDQENERDIDESYDYSSETDANEDPTYIQNRETFTIQSISKEKAVNETIIFHSAEINDTNYPDYQYYDYDYDNDTYTEHENPILLDNDEKRNETTADDYEEEFTSEEEDKNVDVNKDSSNNSILIGEAIVSVVTTKSVVNGTFSVPVTSLPLTTEQLDSPKSSVSTFDSALEPTATESFSVSEKDLEIVSVISEEPRFETTSLRNVGSSSSERSTESMIEKLDRVQSELSSGILATNFGSSGNNVQVDLLNSSKHLQTTLKPTTTLKTPVINKFIPKRYSDRRSYKNNNGTSNTAKTEEKSEEKKSKDQPLETANKNISKIDFFESLLTTTTAKTNVDASKIKLENLPVVVQDISAFLPPGYKIKEETTTKKTLLSEILNKSKVDISAFLPPDYKKDNSQKTISSSVPSTTEKITTTTESVSSTVTIKEKSSNSSSGKISIQDLFAKSEVDLSALLPKDYKQKFKVPEAKVTKRPKEEKLNTITTSPTIPKQSSTTKPAGIKLVFPSRPGGRKPAAKLTTPATPKGDGPVQVTPKIQKGWPTRATTEFTGWPKPSTTPISIEKLLEAARTVTVSSLSNTSVTLATSIVSTTSTTTTTTTTPRPTTPGICDDECKVAGTIRLVGNATWVPELLDRNTREWQELANNIEKEMNYVFSKSLILKKWFKEVKIDSFSQGSILVDYFVELVDVQKPIDTQQIKSIFHDSLYIYNANRYNETSVNSTIKLGLYTIDPKYTDFIVIPKASAPQYIETDRLVPQWAIAVIIIGVGGLFFIIVFGVFVLTNRQNGSKLKHSMSAMYEEEISKNAIHTSNSASSMQRSSDYSKSNTNSIWNETTPTWSHDKVFESNSNKMLMDVNAPFQEDKRYNLYDSWRSEWNGYYYNPSHTSSRYAKYDNTLNLSRHHPDYDTNF